MNFAECEFAPCGPHRKDEFEGLEAVPWSSSVGSPTPFLEYDLNQPVPMHGLREIFAGPWLWTWNVGATPKNGKL